MKSINKHADKEKFWRQQMAAAEKFPGSQKEFCKSQGFSINTFQYWRQKFGQEKKRSQVQIAKPSPFVEVEVLKPDLFPNRMPDAKWLAELIFHLKAGVR